jgi:hypothetical protein
MFGEECLEESGAVIRIHEGGQRGAALSKVKERFAKECGRMRKVAFVLQCWLVGQNI